MKVIEKRDGYVHVIYDEPYAKSVLIDLMKEAHDKCTEFGTNVLLVELSSMPGIISTLDRFELGIQGTLIFRGGYKIAVVYRKEEINRFAENVGVNRGLNTRVFDDLQEAMKWLGINEQ